MNVNNKIYLFFDESGNLGTDGRFFVISCIETMNKSSVKNIIKKCILKSKEIFPNMKYGSKELKAKNAYPCVKDFILKKIYSKDIKIHYIVIDLYHVDQRLLLDKNLLYNFATKILLSRVFKNGFDYEIMCDNHTTKVKSTNTLSEYIKLEFIYERKMNISVNFRFLDSDSEEGYVIQSADFIANAIYSYYEFNECIYYDNLTNKIITKELFPFKKFNK